MEFIQQLIDIFLHVDEYLYQIVTQLGVWTYILLFIVIFAETGLVITPFLPGDSLLFAAGAVTALVPDTLNIFVLIVVLSAAAILGDTVNYWIGHWVGPRAFSGKVRFLKKEHLDKTHAFYEKHGGKTIILARFIPVIRTFAPIVAGISKMHYRRFLAFNLIGAAIWAVGITYLGYFAGSWITAAGINIEYAILAIIFLSTAPPVIHVLKDKKQRVAIFAFAKKQIQLFFRSK